MSQEIDYEALPPNAGLAVSFTSLWDLKSVYEIN